MRLLLVGIGLWMAPAALACGTDAELMATLERASSAWAELDIDGYGAALDEALVILPCLPEPIQPATAAPYPSSPRPTIYVAAWWPAAWVQT